MSYSSTEIEGVEYYVENGDDKAIIIKTQDGSLLSIPLPQDDLVGLPTVYVRRTDQEFNVKAPPFGALGDATSVINSGTDDTAAIQSAIDAANSAYVSTGRRQRVLIPPGRYRVTYGLTHDRPTGYAVFVTGCLLIKAGVDISGGGVIVPDAIPVTTLTAQLVSGATVVSVDSTAGFGSVADVGMQLQCATTTSIISFTGITPTSFTGVTYSGPTLPIGTAISQRIFRCVFITSCGSEITDWSVTNIGIDGQNVVAIEQLHEAFFIGPSKRWKISECTITRMQGKGIHVVGEVGGVARRPNRWAVIGNEIRSIAGNAVGYSQAGAYDFIIADNLFVDNLLNGAEAIISGNQVAIDRGIIRNNRVLSYGDISASGRDMLCEGNIIVTPAAALGPGIQVAIGRNIKIIGNTIDMSAGSSGNNVGVMAATSAVSGLVISDNSIRRASTASGIATQLSSGTHIDVIVSGNMINGFAASAEADISLGQVTDGVIEGNTCRCSLAIYVKASCTRVAIINNLVPAGEVIAQGASGTVVGNIVVGISGLGAVRLNGAGGVCSGNYLKGGGTNGITGVVFILGSNWLVLDNVLENVAANNRWLNESSPANGNIYKNNKLIGTNGNNNIIGATSRFENVESVRVLTKSGIPSDADFAPAPGNGTLAVDETNNKLYVRVGAVWKSVTVA